MKLPEINNSEMLRIIKLEVDGKEFNTLKGPNFEAPKIEHLTHRKITGTINRINGVDFSITGKHVISSKTGFEIYDEQEETIQFSLNDQVRFRVNKNGDIRDVQSINFEEGLAYHIVYSPYNDKPAVEIITELQ